MEKKIIITVAVTGSFPTKEMNPAVPYTPKEIAEAAVESATALARSRRRVNFIMEELRLGKFTIG